MTPSSSSIKNPRPLPTGNVGRRSAASAKGSVAISGTARAATSSSPKPSSSASSSSTAPRSSSSILASPSPTRKSRRIEDRIERGAYSRAGASSSASNRSSGHGSGGVNSGNSGDSESGSISGKNQAKAKDVALKRVQIQSGNKDNGRKSPTPTNTKLTTAAKPKAAPPPKKAPLKAPTLKPSENSAKLKQHHQKPKANEEATNGAALKHGKKEKSEKAAKNKVEKMSGDSSDEKRDRERGESATLHDISAVEEGQSSTNTNEEHESLAANALSDLQPLDSLPDDMANEAMLAKPSSNSMSNSKTKTSNIKSAPVGEHSFPKKSPGEGGASHRAKKPEADKAPNITETPLGNMPMPTPEVTSINSLNQNGSGSGAAIVTNEKTREFSDKSKHSPSFSMTLAIGPSDALRVFDASKAFNIEYQKLENDSTMEEEGESSTDAPAQNGGNKRQNETLNQKKSSTPMSNQLSPPSNRSKRKRDPFATLCNLLLPAARNTSDPLISSFLAKMERGKIPDSEIKTSLLLFLDADKSTKLLAAFEVLCLNPSSNDESITELDLDSKPSAKPSVKIKDTDGDENHVKTGDDEEMLDEPSTKFVDRSGLIRLFQSLLTSISACVHGEDEKRASRASTPTVQNKSPALGADNSKSEWEDENDGDWKGSDRTHREIVDISTVAADNLIDYSRKQINGIEGKVNGISDLKTNAPEKGHAVSFDVFGRWYNSGGFSLVPWLELLDLAKWDHSETDPSAESSESPNKRARHEPSTPGLGAAEMIGSPTALFATGAAVGAMTPQPKTVSLPAEIQSFSAIFGGKSDSRTVVSFDFSGSTPEATSGQNNRTNSGSFNIDISEENLLMLRNLVQRSCVSNLSPKHAEEVMMNFARLERRKYSEDVYVISRQQFNKFIREVVPKEASKKFNATEIENFSNYFTNFFTCFDYSWSDLKKDEVNAKELMVGFSFLCAGNKSSKLAAAFEMLDIGRNGYLTQRGLLQYLRSYLTMLAGISLLSSSKKTTTQIRKRLMSQQRHDAFVAVENGAKWTLAHFLRAFEAEHKQHGSTRSNAVAFEDFAKWYTEGGYAVAPWLELLDLKKFLSLIGEAKQTPQRTKQDQEGAEILFTFPLAKERSLVVLRDDAHYVRSVVAELGLLSLTSEDIWGVLFKDVTASLKKESASKKKVSVEVDQSTFVQSMMRILSPHMKNPKEKSSWPNFSPEETLKNFFLSFDLEQTNRVALNQLMCGLTLLCGGKKSSKLIFAFGLFDGDKSPGKGKNGKKKASMSRDEFFFFFRSFLIVMFSCCNQSLDLSGDDVSQYISDTAHSVADDVMGFQWRARKSDKVKFDHFSEWYNEGGFETAPWLELLDLNKWILPNGEEKSASQEPPLPTTPAPPPAPVPARSPPPNPALEPAPEPSPNHEFKALLASPRPGDCPPPPDDDPLFDLDMSAVDGEVDEMDFILQNDSSGPSREVEHVHYEEPTARQAPQNEAESQNSLKFHLLTHDAYRGYMISISPQQVSLLNRIVTETGLYQTDATSICNSILGQADKDLSLSRQAFDSAMSDVFPHTISQATQHELSNFLSSLFVSFDRTRTETNNAIELACGFTVLCGGRKSDKLEHVFDLLDEDKDGLLSRRDILRFIQSFLIILMNVSSSFTLLDGVECNNDSSTIARAIDAGSQWAASQVFDAVAPGTTKISFDEFADWYTKGGYQSIPWLELLDLRKWVLGDT